MTQGPGHAIFTHSRGTGGKPPPRRTGFTLIEVMLAVLLMALLASAVALSFSGPLQRARAEDAQQTLRSFDAAARQMATRWGRPVRVVFDVSAGTLSRREGQSLQEPRSRIALPSGYRVDEIRVEGRGYSDGEAVIDYSALGLSRSYAAHLSGPGLDRWLLFAGLSGEMTQAQDESAVESILGNVAPTSYRPWAAAGHDAD